MHQLLGTLRSADLVQRDCAGRHEHFTDTDAKRLVGAYAAVAAVQERMLATIDSEQRRRLYADLVACADAFSQAEPDGDTAPLPPARCGSGRGVCKTLVAAEEQDCRDSFIL